MKLKNIVLRSRLPNKTSFYKHLLWNAGFFLLLCCSKDMFLKENIHLKELREKIKYMTYISIP